MDKRHDVRSLNDFRTAELILEPFRLRTAVRRETGEAAVRRMVVGLVLPRVEPDQGDLAHAERKVAVERNVAHRALGGQARHHHLSEPVRRRTAEVMVAAVEDDRRVRRVAVVLRRHEVVLHEILALVRQACRDVPVPYDERHAQLAVLLRDPRHLPKLGVGVAHHAEMRRSAFAGRRERMDGAPDDLRRLRPVADWMFKLRRTCTVPVPRAGLEARHSHAQHAVVDAGERHPLRHEACGVLHLRVVGDFGETVGERRDGESDAHRVGRRHLQHGLAVQ